MYSSSDLKLAMYRQVFETNHDAVLLLDAAKRVIDCNEKTMEMFAATREQLVNMPLQLMSPIMQPDGSSSLEKADTLLNMALQGQKQIFEWVYKRLDYQTIDTEVVLQPFNIDDQAFVEVLIRDITQQKQTENTIRENEAKFQILANNAPVFMKMTNANNYYYYFNRQWQEFVGSTEEGQQNNGWLDHIHPNDLNITLATLDMAFKKRKRFETQYRLRRFDGEYRTLMDTGVPYFDNQNNFKGYITSALDITERLVGEEQRSRMAGAQATVSHLQQSLKNAHLLSITLDKKGTVLECNPYFSDITGWQKQEIIGRSWKSFWDVSEFASGNIELLFPESDRVINSTERRLNTKYLDTLIVRFNIVLLSGARSDAPNYMLIGEDITEKRRVQQRLKDTNEQLQDFLENANDLIVFFDITGKLLFVNKAWKETLGYDTIEELNIWNLIPQQNRDQTKKYIEKILAEKSSEKFETILCTKSDKKIYLSASINAKFDEEKPVIFRGIFHDITDKVRAEKAQKLYYSIANLIIESDNLQTLYENIYYELENIIDTQNFYIALKATDDRHIHFVYNPSEDSNEKQKNISIKLKDNGLTEYAMNYSKPLFLYEEQIIALIQEKKIEVYGSIPKIWIGVPLKINNEVTGIIAAQSFENNTIYDEKDLELLDFISGQIALAIQRKQNEEKISKQSARLNAIFESSSHIMWSLDKNFQLTSSNGNYQNITHHHFLLPPIIPHRSYDMRIVKPHHHTALYRRYEEAFEGRPQHFEIQDKNENKEDRWLEIFLNPIYWNENHIAEVSGIAHDITQKKHNEIALKESEEQFRNIFESFQDIYFRTDKDGNFLMISPSILEVCGYKQDQIIGKNIRAFYLYNIRRKHTIRELYRKGRIKNFEVPIITDNGNVLNFISNIHIIYDKSGKIAGAEGVARDITELKKASEASEKAKEIAERSLKVKEQFLANMSHEIRTPMNGVIGVVDLLSYTNLNPQQTEYVQTIKKSSEALLTILNDILDFSKIEAGKMELRLATVSLQSTLEKLFALYKHQALAKNIKINYLIDNSVPMFLRTDETRLLQILSNLTSNAIKFTEEGQVAIKVNIETKKNTTYTVRVEVSDSGIGISAENMKLLFGYFEQVDTSSTKSYGGTGLGLAISKHLSNMLKGDIGVYSEEGKGSTFWFTFKAKAAKAETFIKPKENKAPQFVFTKRNPYVLLVDDNAINQNVACQILKNAGCIVDLADNGLKAIEKVKENDYEIVLMDIQMPQMDGVTAMLNIRGLQLPKTPIIIAMTAYSMQDDREKYIKAGMDDYISKPIKAEKLIKTIRDWLEPKRGQSLKNQYKEQVCEVADESQQSTCPIINFDVLDQLRKHVGDDILNETLREFDQEAHALLNDCLTAAASHNIAAILSALHTLKGNSSTLGIERVAMLAKSVESDLKQEKTTMLDQDLQVLTEAIKEFSESYVQLLQL